MRALRQLLGHRIAEQRATRVPASDWAAPALRLWDDASPVEGTLGQCYLRDVRGITFVPPDVRFHPRCPMGKGGLRSASFPRFWSACSGMDCSSLSSACFSIPPARSALHA